MRAKGLRLGRKKVFKGFAKRGCAGAIVRAIEQQLLTGRSHNELEAPRPGDGFKTESNL